MLHIRLFGSPVITLSDQPLSLTRSTTQIILFAFLVTHRERSHSRSVLAAMLWPDLPESRARHNLNNTLWELRNMLKANTSANYLLSDNQTAQFNSDAPFWLDVAEFEKLTSFLHRSLAHNEGIDSEAIDQLEYAVSLYRADFLEGIYADWCVTIRETLRETYLLTLEALIRLHRADDRLESALHAAHQLTRADPLREEAYFQLIQLQALLNRPNEAQAQYRCYEAVWRDELKAEPSDRMKMLIHQIDPEVSSSTGILAEERLTEDIQLLKKLTAALPDSSTEGLERQRTWSQIANYGDRVGHALRTRYANSDALRYLALAAEAMVHLPTTHERALRELTIRRECDELCDLISDRKQQAENLARIEQLAIQLGDPSIQIETLARQAWLMTRKGHYPQAIVLLQEMCKRCRARSDGEQEALAHRLLGIVYDEMGEFLAAIDHHAQALALDEAIKASIYLDLNNLANVLTVTGDYSEALNNLQRAHALLPPNATPLIRATITGNIGNLWIRFGQMTMASNCLQEAMGLARQAGDREVECWLGGKLATLYQRRSETDRALTMAHHFYQVALEIEAPQRLLELASLLSKLYSNSKNKSKALSWADCIYELACAKCNWRYQLRGLMHQALALLLLDQSDQAFVKAQFAVAGFDKRNQPLEEEPELFYTLAQCARMANQAEIATTASRRAKIALLRQADWIEDANLRQTYLLNHPLHSAILSIQDSA